MHLGRAVGQKDTKPGRGRSQGKLEAVPHHGRGRQHGIVDAARHHRGQFAVLPPKGHHADLGVAVQGLVPFAAHVKIGPEPARLDAGSQDAALLAEPTLVADNRQVLAGNVRQAVVQVGGRPGPDHFVVFAHWNGGLFSFQVAEIHVGKLGPQLGHRAALVARQARALFAERFNGEKHAVGPISLRVVEELRRRHEGAAEG